MTHRRNFIASVGFPLLLAGLSQKVPAQAFSGRTQNARSILLRSSWQTVNIGDIAHTPGLLRLLEEHLPDWEVYLWPSSIADGVEELLKRRFPKLKLVQKEEEIEEAFTTCDFFLHGSGPSLVGEKDLRRWVDKTKKPFGVYGITLARQSSTEMKPVSAERFQNTVDLLGRAEFVYFRDSRSLALAKVAGCKSPVMEFAPDGAFATDLQNETRALAFLESSGLKAGGFVCCIPRLRYTPYWLIPSKHRPIDLAKHARNEEKKNLDHEPLLNAIDQIVSKTSLQVLLCPEDQTQMAVAKEMIWDRLSSRAQSRVVHRSTFWLTDEALSIYRASVGLFGHEMHSPIMCIGNGIPAIVCRWAEQTSKGFMWQDIGLGDWLFDFDKEEDRERMPDATLKMVTQREWAIQNTMTAKSFVEQRQVVTMDKLKEVLAKTRS